MMMAKMRSQNPQLFDKAMQMIRGKSEAELKEMATNIGNERGIDVSKLTAQDVAKKFGM